MEILLGTGSYRHQQWWTYILDRAAVWPSENNLYPQSYPTSSQVSTEMGDHCRCTILVYNQPFRPTQPPILSGKENGCWWLVNVCVHHQRRRSSSLRHAFPLPVTALSPWLRCGHGTACRHLSKRYLHWRPLGISWRRNCLSEAFLISIALSTTASDSYSISSFASQSRFVNVFVRCPCSLLTLRHLNLFF